MTGRVAGLDTVVVGAGIGGLACALALAQRGARVRVLEQAPALQDVGSGIQISPNGRVVLQSLGLGDAVARLGVVSQGVELWDGLSGRRVLRMDLSAARAGVFLHRADLVGLLADAVRAAGVQIDLGVAVEAWDTTGTTPVLVTDSGSGVTGRLIIGADGLKSRLHKALNDAPTPFFTGQVAWRAVIPEPPGADAVAQVHMGPGRHLVTYPVRGGAWRNIVAVEERQAWTAEGWAQRDDPAHLQAAFAGYSPQVRGWLGQVVDVGLWGLFRHPVAKTWTRAMPHGGVALLGDAAHPTLPFLAQGANMALEDAYVLASVVDQMGVTAAALGQYQHIRAVRCRALVDAATGNARIYHMRAPWRRPVYAALKLAGAVAPGAMLRRYDWIWGHDVTRADQWVTPPA